MGETDYKTIATTSNAPFSRSYTFNETGSHSMHCVITVRTEGGLTLGTAEKKFTVNVRKPDWQLDKISQFVSRMYFYVLGREFSKADNREVQSAIPSSILQNLQR